MSISLEEICNEWVERSRRLDQQLRLNTHLLRGDWIERQRERIWKLGPFGKLSLTIWVATMVLLGFFLGTHAKQPALFLSALVLDLWVIGAGIAQVRQQQALRNLDFGMPLIELQTRIEALRIARIRAFNWAFLTGQIVWWIPFVVVFCAGVFGANLYLSSQFRTFATWNIAGGIALIPLAIWLSHRHGERLSRSSTVRHIADSITGRDIAVAREFLEKLRQFAAETN